MERNQILAIVVVVVIVGAAGAYFLLLPPAPPPRPNSIVYETIGNPQYLDPATDYETFGNWIIYNCYETLVWYPFNSISTVPTNWLLATGVTISGDGLNYTFALRHGVTFQDGTPFNASCVVYNLDRVMKICDPDGPAWILGQCIVGGGAVLSAVNDFGMGSTQHMGNYSAFIAGNPIIALDQYTVRIRLAFSYSPFLACMAYTVASIISPSWIEAHGGVGNGTHNTYVDTHTCGTGPYQVTSWVPDDHISIDLAGNYWGKSLDQATYPYAANITSITIKTNEDVNSRILNLKAGTSDGGLWPADYIDQIWNKQNGSSGDGTVKSSISTLKLWCQEPTFDVMFIGFNMNPTLNRSGTVVKSPFTIKDLRYSLSYAFDYETYISTVLNGLAEQANGPIPRAMFGHNDSQPLWSYDHTKAVQYWNLAMTKGLDAIFANMSYHMEIYYNSGNTVREKACLLLKDGIEAILADPTATQPNHTLAIDVVSLEWASYLFQVQHKQLPIFYLGWAPDYADPDDYVGPYCQSGGTFAKRIGLAGSGDGYNQTLMDEWIAAAGQSTNATERQILYGKITSYIDNQAAYLFVDQGQNIEVESRYLNGYWYNPMLVAGPYFYLFYKTFAVGITT